MSKPISQERIDLANQVQALAMQYTSKEVAEITGKSQPYIKSLAQDFGISFFQPKVDDHDIYLIREVRRRYGLPLAEIAQKFDISTGFCCRLCAGIKKPSKAQLALA